MIIRKELTENEHMRVYGPATFGVARNLANGNIVYVLQAENKTYTVELTRQEVFDMREQISKLLMMSIVEEKYGIIPQETEDFNFV